MGLILTVLLPMNQAGRGGAMPVVCALAIFLLGVVVWAFGCFIASKS